MDAIGDSPLGYAIDYARSGRSVIWVDDSMSIRDVLKHAEEAVGGQGDVTIRRANGRECIEFHGGGTVRFFRTSTAVRGWSADVAFVDALHRKPDAMATITPALVASELGYIYSRFERVL